MIEKGVTDLTSVISAALNLPWRESWKDDIAAVVWTMCVITNFAPTSKKDVYFFNTICSHLFCYANCFVSNSLKSGI